MVETFRQPLQTYRGHTQPMSLSYLQNMTLNFGAVAFSSTHWKSTIKVQAHPAELNKLV